MNADKLREKARELLKKAEAVEQAKAIKVGQAVLKHHKTGFKGVTIQQIAEEVGTILEPKQSTKTEDKKP